MLLKNKLEIEEWLNKNHVHSYELIEDDEYGYVVNVNSFVKLNHKKLKSIDVKFNIVKGWFDCSYNELTSLEGSPKKVTGSFMCHKNEIFSLKGGPKEVGGSFIILHNNITSLEFSPSVVKEDFICSHNPLKPIRHCQFLQHAKVYLLILLKLIFGWS